MKNKKLKTPYHQRAIANFPVKQQMIVKFI